ncbi:MAG: SMC-Scp complex subunit ScpB [Acidimicrobiales bacterium]
MTGRPAEADGGGGDGGASAEFADPGPVIEAIILVATDPVPAQLLAQLVELPLETVDARIRLLAAEYTAQGRGFELVEVAGGWRFQTHPDLAPYLERYALDGQSTRMSNAALETLAIVAYKQPISRAQVSAIRGVNVDGVLRTLVQRGYVEEVGRDLGAGQATMFGTTTAFLERLGLRDLGDLPSLGEFVPSAAVVEALESTLTAETDAAVVADTDRGDGAGTGDAPDPGRQGNDDGSGPDTDDVPPLDLRSVTPADTAVGADPPPANGSGPAPDQAP